MLTEIADVRLDEYLKHPTCKVGFHCLRCSEVRVAEVEDVISRLVSKGLGGPETGIRALAGVVSQPCRKCGGLEFETLPEWKKPEAWPIR